MEQKINPLHANQSRQHSTAHANSGRNGQAVRQNAANVSSQAGRTAGSAPSGYGVAKTPASLHVGDVLRGEVTDLRNNEITLTLEDNTVLHAKIPNSASYSIGQSGSFRLSDIDGKTIYLENISIGYSESERTLINKALDEANLPATERNQATVKALMDNVLPINRESIQNLMQQAYDLQTEDMNTLAVMKRLMMEVNADSVEQFSNYRNDSHQLLGRLQNFSQNLPALLGALAENGPADAVADFGKSMLAIGLSASDGTMQPQMTLADLPTDIRNDIIKMLADIPLTEDAIQQINNRTLSLQDSLTLLRDAALNGSLSVPEGESAETFAEQMNQICQVLEPTSDSTPILAENFVKNVLTLNQPEEMASSAGEKNVMEETQTSVNTEKPAQDAATNAQDAQEAAENPAQEKAESRFAFAGRLLQSISENAKNTFSNTLETLKNATAPKEVVLSTPNPSLQALTETFEKFSRSQDLLSNYLSANERGELSNRLQDFPISQAMMMKIVSGEASTKEVLTVIYNTIGLTDSEQVKDLFQSEVFGKLFAKQLQSTWTITPEQLAKGNLSEFYSKIHSQMRQYQSLIQSSLSGSDSQQSNSFAHDIEQNISFMKTLNETFSYFQLPLKLPSQDAHGDLYVYTQKERLRQNPDKSSVLLHLNMEHLGTVDIRLDRNRNDINAQFSLNGRDSVHLFRVNENMLKDALNMLGYSCQAKFQEKEQPSPTVDSFINTKVNTHATAEMKRFSFDIRA